MPVTAVAALSAAAIVRAIGDAADRWSDADFPPRVRATRAIEARTGYGEPTIDYALDAVFAELRSERLAAAIADEAGSLAALDGVPLARGGDLVLTLRPAGSVAIVASATTIGVALMPLAFALAAKNRVTVKDRSDELVRAFAQTLCEERPEFAESLVARQWTGPDDPVAIAALGGADTVVAFGGDDALRAIRARCTPEARFVPYGYRTSAGYLEREALGSRSAVARLAESAARDALLYDGDGCLSLHALFVERGGAVDPAAFAAELARACDAATIEFPSTARTSTRRAGRIASAAFRAATSGRTAVYHGLDDAYVVLVDPPADEPPPLDRRTLAVYTVDGPEDARAFLQAHRLPLEGFAVADAATLRDDVRALADATTAARVCALGELQRPPLAGPHGGVSRLDPFVRYRYRG